MITFDQIVKETAQRTQVDEAIVATICRHIFNCCAESMKDDSDIRNILLHNFIKFKPKTRFKHEILTAKVDV